MLPNQPLTPEMISELRRSGDSCRIEIGLKAEDIWSADYTHKHDIDRFIEISKLPVICRSIRESNPSQITVDKPYVIDRHSIWIDRDGDSYGTVYDLQGNRIGQMLLSHFRCI